MRPGNRRFPFGTFSPLTATTQPTSDFAAASLLLPNELLFWLLFYLLPGTLSEPQPILSHPPSDPVAAPPPTPIHRKESPRAMRCTRCYMLLLLPISVSLLPGCWLSSSEIEKLLCLVVAWGCCWFDVVALLFRGSRERKSEIPVSVSMLLLHFPGTFRKRTACFSKRSLAQNFRVEFHS